MDDKYLLEITSSAKGINKVAGDLDRLKTSLKGFTFSPTKVNAFNNFSTSVTALGKATSTIDTGKIIALSSALKQLNDVKIKLPQGMDKTVQEIEKAFKGLGDTKELFKKVNSFQRIMQPLSNLKFGGISGASDAIKNLDKALEGLDFRKIHGEADALNRSLKPLADTMDKIAKASVDMGLGKAFGKGVGNAYKGLTDALSGKTKKTLSTKGTDEDRWQKGYSKLTVTSTEDITTFQDRLDALKEKATSVAGAVVNAFKMIASAVKAVVKVVKTTVKAIALIPKAISKIGVLNPFKGLATSISNVYKKIKTLWSSLARIAMYRALRSAIKEIAQAVREGLTNLYYWSQATGGDFAPAMDRLASSALYLKNSFGAMVSPVITYFTPAIEQATDALVEMLNVVNQLLAKLTGRATWTRALRYPTEFAERASGATKKVKDNIQDFDELHILRTDNGGGGASGMDYNNMFEETAFTEDLVDWVENFKTALRNGRFYEAGNILADEINGVINRIPWGRLGDKLADKVNDMFQFAWGVLHNIDFVNIGTSIATFLNHAIDSIDTHTIGQVFARKWTAIIDFLYGFVTTFDFPAFGWRISEFVQGWFDELDGARLGYTISEAIKGVLDSAIAFMSNDDMFEAFVEDIADMINNIDWYGIFVRVVDIGTRVLNALADTINRVMSGSSNNGSSSALSQYDFSSAPTAIAQRMQAQVSGYTGGDGTRYFNSANQGSFGDRVVNSLTTSLNQVDTASLIQAFVNLLRAVWNAVKPAISTIFHIGSEELISGIDDSISGGHYDNNGNWVVTNQDLNARRGQRSSNRIWGTLNAIGQGSRTGVGQATAHAVTHQEELPWYAQSPAYTLYNWVKGTDRLDRSTKTLNADTSNFNRTMTSVNTGMKTFSSESVEGVKSVESAFDTFGNRLGGEVVSKVMSAKSSITSSFASMKDEATNSLATLGANVVASMQNTASTVTAPLQGIKNNIVSVFREAGQESVTSISDLSTRMSGALNGLVQSSKGQLEGYKGLWQELHGATKGVSNSVIDGSERMANAVTDAFNSLLNNLDGFEIDVPNYRFKTRPKSPLSHITIPKLATGGIVSSPTTALIGEAGREAVLPLENNTDWMNTLADRINGGSEDEVALLREQNDLLRQIASKNVTISSRDVFNAVRDENSDYITRTGQNALAF